MGVKWEEWGAGLNPRLPHPQNYSHPPFTADLNHRPFCVWMVEHTQMEFNMFKPLFLSSLFILAAGCGGGEPVAAIKEPAADNGEGDATIIAAGTPIAMVEAANGKPFIIYGWEIDGYLEGKTKSWEGGALSGHPMPTFTFTTFNFGIAGDHIRSDNPQLTQAGVVVK
jgi:hypothetical protein